MRVTILPHTMFDEGSFECFNFWLSHSDGTDQVSANHPVIAECRPQIEAAIAKGGSYITMRELVYGGLEILEIQWG